MRLSQYFNLEEMTVSQYAVRKGIANIPTGQEMPNLMEIAQKMDEVRRLLGKPIYVSSGFRNPEVNKAVGGSATSDHVKGLAVDFTCPEFGTVKEVFDAIRKSALRYDQIISEFDGSWVHIGFGKRLRHEQLIAKRINGKVVYEVAK